MSDSTDIVVLDVLEKRIEDLEKKLFGNRKVTDVQKPETCLLDSLKNANTLISSALSGRENINSLISKLPELEKFTESDFNTVDVLPQTQQEYLIAKEDDIREQVQLVSQMKELEPLLDSDRYRNILGKSTQLHELSLKYINLYKHTETLQKETHDMLDRYNCTLENLSKIVIAMDSRLTDIEEKVKPKKVLD